MYWEPVMELTTHAIAYPKAVRFNAKPTLHREGVDLIPILAAKYAGHARTASQIVQEGDAANYFIYLIEGGAESVEIHDRWRDGTDSPGRRSGHE